MSIRFATINSTAPTLRTTPGTTIRRIGVRYPIATATWPSGLAIRAKRARERLFEIRRMPAGATSPSKAVLARRPKGRQAGRMPATEKRVGSQPRGKQDRRRRAERQSRPPERPEAARRQRAANRLAQSRLAQSRLRAPSKLHRPDRMQQPDSARGAAKARGLARVQLALGQAFH